MKLCRLAIVLSVCLLVIASPLAVLAEPNGPPGAVPQTLPDGSIVGVPWTGERGVTETVAQIMERQRAADAAAAANPNASGPKVLKPWLDYSTVPLKRANPNAPDVSQWPPAPAGANAAAVGPFSPQTIGVNFKGVGLSESGYIPPDSMGDAGPTQILMHENGRIKLFDKAGNPDAGLDATDAVFWASVAAGISDPEVRYDRLSGRWFINAISIAETVNNEIVIAVSDGPTITNQSSFTFYQFNVGTVAAGDAASFCDYPTLGIDNNALYSGCNMFSSAGAYRWTSAFVIRKSSVTGGGPIVATGFTNLTGGTSGAGPWSPMGVDNDNACATEGYFIGADNAAYGLLQVRRVSTPGGTPTLSGNLSLTVPNTYIPNTQPALGSTTNLDGNDDRLIKAALHTNKITGATTLWTVHGFRMTTACARATTGSRNGSRWYEITGSAPTAAAPLGGNMTLVQSGSLCDPATTNTKGYIYASVIETGQGHMVLGATVAAANLYAGIIAAGRLRTDALGATQATTSVQAGLNSYTQVANGRNRWGDYSFTDVDPNDDMTVWTFQEYADTPANNWAVRATQLKAPAPPPSSPTPATIPQASAAQTVVCNRTSGTLEFFDPGTDSCGGPGWANHLSATATNNVAVNSIAFNSISQVTLSLDTTASTPNTPSVITISNPDGQTATCTVQVGSPLAITLASLNAVAQTAAIEVTWETVSEVGNAGFNLYRATSPDGPRIQLNSSLIPSQGPGSQTGYSYSYLDAADLVPGTTYTYWLEDVSLTGGTAQHAPISVLYAGSPTALRLGRLRATAAAPLGLAFAAAGALLAGAALRRRRS